MIVRLSHTTAPCHTLLRALHAAAGACVRLHLACSRMPLGACDRLAKIPVTGLHCVIWCPCQNSHLPATHLVRRISLTFAQSRFVLCRHMLPA